MIDHNTPFKQNRPLHFMLVPFVSFWIWMAIWPNDRRDWLLENVLLVLFVAVLVILYRRFVFGNVSYLLIILFLTLHTVGAHYTYQDTPVDFWYKNMFHGQRGIYDRIVHLAFGLLMAYPIWEVAIRCMKLRMVWSYVVAFSVLMASSGLYEILEMWTALLADPKLAAQYLGMQGDVFDTQKDMTMTLLGVVLSIVWMVCYHYFRRRKVRL